MTTVYLDKIRPLLEGFNIHYSIEILAGTVIYTSESSSGLYDCCPSGCVKRGKKSIFVLCDASSIKDVVEKLTAV